MPINPMQLLIIIGELTVENRVLRAQIAEREQHLAAQKPAPPPDDAS